MVFERGLGGEREAGGERIKRIESGEGVLNGGSQ